MVLFMYASISYFHQLIDTFSMWLCMPFFFVLLLTLILANISNFMEG